MSVQSMQALAVANKQRVRKATLKRRLAAMPASDALELLAVLIEGEDTVLGSCRVGEALRSVRYVGERKAMAVGRHVGVSTDRHVSGLTERQRGVLASVLRSERILPRVAA